MTAWLPFLGRRFGASRQVSVTREAITSSVDLQRLIWADVTSNYYRGGSVQLNAGIKKTDICRLHTVS